MMEGRGPSVYRRSACQIVAGGTAGLVEICIMHPLDIIKTRLQIQGLGQVGGTQYTSLADCARSIVRNEGLLSIYKGIFPPILAETPRRATKFFSYECYKIVCSSLNFTGPWSLVVAGTVSGATEGLVLAPFERVKVYMQSQRTQAAQMPSTWTVTREIVRRDGLGTRGLLRGLTALLARDSVYNAVYFGGYYNMKQLLPRPEYLVERFVAQGNFITLIAIYRLMSFYNLLLIVMLEYEMQESISVRLVLGFISGFIGGFINLPFDVAKSRIQGPQRSDKYLRTLSTISTVWREEGFRALFKGLVPRLLRLGPGGAIMLVVYEQVLHYLVS